MHQIPFGIQKLNPIHKFLKSISPEVPEILLENCPGLLNSDRFLLGFCTRILQISSGDVLAIDLRFSHRFLSEFLLHFVQSKYRGISLTSFAQDISQMASRNFFYTLDMDKPLSERDTPGLRKTLARKLRTSFLGFMQELLLIVLMKFLRDFQDFLH